jgi:hypothetical protein
MANVRRRFVLILLGFAINIEANFYFAKVIGCRLRYRSNIFVDTEHVRIEPLQARYYWLSSPSRGIVSARQAVIEGQVKIAETWKKLG